MRDPASISRDEDVDGSTPGSEPTARARHSTRAVTNLARQLRLARLTAGLTGTQVKRLTGIDPGALSRMEQGQRSPSPACLMVLAEAYGVPVEELIAAEKVDSLQTVTTLSSNLAVLEFLAVPVVRWRDVVLRHWHADPQLHGNAMRFASDLFDPVCRTLGVPLIVNVGYRPLECDTCSVREGAWASAHTKALAADVRPVGLYLSSAMQFLRDAVERGDLPYLDLAKVTASRAIHIQAAGPGQRGRQVVEDGVPDACSGRRLPARAERSPRRRGPVVHD